MSSLQPVTWSNAVAPVAPHFGDFVIGTPALVENAGAVLAAGSTSIGNLGQYSAFGGKLNQVPQDSASSMPVDVSAELQSLGAIVCHQIEDMVESLVGMARGQGA